MTLTENTRVRMAAVPAHTGTLQHIVADGQGWVCFDGNDHLTTVALDKLEAIPGAPKVRPLEPQHQSATRRRELRSRIRNTLGSSRESAPEAAAALRAAFDVSELAERATDGRFTVTVYDNRRAVFVDLNTALKIARGQDQ